MKNNFDGYIKNKLDQRQFEFDNDNWLKAAQLLDQEDDSKKGGFFWLKWASAILLLLTTVSVAYYYTNINTNNIGLSQETVKQNVEEVIPSHAYENSEKLNEFSDETHTQNENQTANDTRNSSATGGSSDVNQASASLTIRKQPTFKKKHFASNENPALTNYTLESNHTRKNPVILTKTKSQDLVQNKIILIDFINDRFNLIDIPKITLIPNYLDVSVLKHDSKISAHPNTLQFAMRAGILGSTFQKSFKNISYSGGLVISYPFSNRWSVNLEGDYVKQYLELNTLKTSKRVSYSFGKNISDDALTPNRFHMIEIPLYISYRLGQNPYKYQVNFGASITKLIQVGGDVITSFEEESNINQSGAIVTNAFNSIHWNGLIGVEYHLTKRINFGLRATYNFSDFVNPNYENQGFIQQEPSAKTRLELNTKIRLF